MNNIVKFLEGNKESAVRQGIAWNAAASIVYSMQSAVLLLVVTRAGGLVAAGIFSISYSVSQMFASIGSYSMREYQVSDVKNRFSVDTYITSRYLTVAVMLLVCFLYSVYHGYGGERLIVLMMLSVYRAVDGLDDVYHGEYQKKGRLDIAAKILTVRIVAASVIFSVVFAVSKNLVLSALTMMLSAIIISMFCDHAMNRIMHIKSRFCSAGIVALLISSFPVCIGSFLYNYLVNSPKYAIDNILNEEMQAVFNIIFMPVFVINMFGQFVFKPFVLSMGKAWNEKRYTELLRLIFRLALVIAAFTVIVVIGGALLGIPVLSFIYGVDLGSYRSLFILLLLFGGISALNSFSGAILTVMRKQVYILVAYVIALVVDVALMNRIVAKYGLWGAGLVYGLAMAAVLIVCVTVIIINFIKSVAAKGEMAK